ncbi:TolC family protein [Citrobacter farmeri]|uniref:TolC family protein n=1 Tax=Citrobacter sedlakii TaxID=67826 RepID=UPI0020BE3852|nr:TolC family protein [Citrobacter sedlakii]MCK8148014.1 TolC family protein [Citrobacter sedlakii]HCJ6323682.1 TolC family protein [Citrobacter sedlakii]HEM7927717.1 TolC family protein [Citrobacter farmeri]
MNRLYFLFSLLPVIPFSSLAWSDTASLQPSQAMPRQGLPASSVATAVSLNDRTIDLTLSDAIYLGLRDNRSIRSMYLDRIAQKFDLRVAEDRFTPKLMLSAGYISERNQDDRWRQGNITPTTTLLTPYGTRVSLGWAGRHTRSRDAGRSSNDGANISVIQPLLRGAGKEIATAPVRMARLNEQLNRLSLKLTVSLTVTRIITAYRELLQAQEQVKIARESLARSRQLVGVNRAMIAAGRMAEFDIVQTEADVASQELALEDARNQLDATRLALLQLLALDLNTPVVASDDLQVHQVEVNTRQAFLQAEASQPAWLAQLITSEQAAIDLAVAGNNRLWDVSLVGGASQVHDRSEHGGASRTWDNYIGVQVEIPVGDLSARQAEVQAQVNVKTSVLRQQEASQQLERDVTNAVRDIATRWRQYEIALRVRDLSRRKLEIEREKLTVGRSSNFQVLSFENDLRNAEYARLNALITYLNTQTQLDQTLGTTLQSWDITLND